MVQKSPVLAAISKAVANRILQELTKLAENEPEKFATDLGQFRRRAEGRPSRGPERRDELFKLARFASTTIRRQDATLDDYVADLRPNQTAIYYITGDDAKRLAASPQLEGFRARGIEVLLLADPVDAFWVRRRARL